MSSALPSRPVVTARVKPDAMEREITALSVSNTLVGGFVNTEGKDLRTILAEVFGYHGFRDGQESIMRQVADGGDAVVLMPTGGGKSLCYQVPALARRGMAIIVSPLIALMIDQVTRLRECGVSAATLNSSATPDEQRQIREDILAGRLKFLYVSPERFTSESFRDLVADVNLSLIAIDEAHCVSSWGHDFRKDYMMIGPVAASFSGVPRMAVTATASLVTRADMVKNLQLEAAPVFLSTFDRPNISYTIVDAVSRDRQRKDLLDFMEDHRGESGVVYCLSRTKTEAIAEFLCENGYDAVPYHAGFDNETKARNQTRFMKGEGVVAVATIAFGMGIDKPDARFVAHLDIPESLEAYYQETGRAGRDGLPAVAWMSFGPSDLAFRRNNIWTNQNSSDAYKRLAFGRLQALVSMVEGPECRRAVVLRYFGETHSGKCTGCDRCLNPVETFDATEATRMILSASARTGERFGEGHLVDIVCGTMNDKMVSLGHNKLPTFGIGRSKGKSREWWGHIVRQMFTRNLLNKTIELNSGYHITDDGMEVMRGQRAVMLIDPPRRTVGRRSFPARNHAAAGVVSAVKPLGIINPGASQEAQDLYNALRKLRRRLADEKNVPPYVIFHDATLLSIVQAMPDTLHQLSRILGMGKTKIDKYGMLVLALVAEHRPQTPAPDRITVPGFSMRR
jgi:ATP-dependent DNA helicase RecQ